MPVGQRWPVKGLSGFEHAYVTINGTRIHFVSGGQADGPTILLFAGFPQTWYAWRKVLPALGKHYNIVAPDLPGQGDSDLPTCGCSTEPVAGIVHELMRSINAKPHFVVAHDIGAWAAYPYVASFSSQVKGLAILDTGIPGISLPDNLPWTPEVAWRTWHVAFHNVADLPEALIEGRERLYLEWFLQRKAANPLIFDVHDVDEYLRAFLKSGLKGGLAYYRAINTSAEQNRRLSAQGKLKMPVLAVRADQGSMPDLVAQLQKIAENVRGTAIEACGHYIAEEQPEALVNVLREFVSND